MPFVAQPREVCAGCGKTVYATEKVVIEDRDEKKVYHKTCIRCKECNKALTVAQTCSLEGTFYCKTHFQQLFKTKGNYDEAFGVEKKHQAAYVAAPASFVPGDRDDSASPAPKKVEASSETQAKFRAFRTEGDSRRCRICDKTVYAAEEVKAEERGQTFLYHKACFKCQYFDELKEDGDKTCNRSLDIRTYGSHEAKIYCDTHLKLVAKSNAAKWGGVGQSAPASFVPASETSDTPTQQRKETPSHIASKFAGAATEKCKACGKSVYATEKCIVEEKGAEKSVYHKNCLKCADCQCKLDMSTFVSLSGILYCKVHSHERTRFAAQAKDEAYFVSPLAAAAGGASTGSRVDADQPGRSVHSDSEDDAPKRGRSPSPAAAGSRSASSSPSPASAKSRSPSPAPAAKAAEPEPEAPKAAAPADDDEAEFARRKAQREAERDERKRQQEKEDAEREAARAERVAARETRQADTSAPAATGEDAEIAELEKRKAERARRRAELEAEAAKEEAEAAAKREERRRRLAELKDE